MPSDREQAPQKDITKDYNINSANIFCHKFIESICQPPSPSQVFMTHCRFPLVREPDAGSWF